MANSEASRLVLRKDVAELKRLAGWIEGFTQERTSPDVSFAVQLCLEEAVANIIMYGARRDDPLEIAVELERNGENLVARIEDNGQQFDPTRAPPPVSARSLEEAKVGELGIHLMRSFATGMDYERRDGRNRLTLRFVEPPLSAAE
ncbi:MAG: ATP-binding protein [Alphaproteobacteria bacterium]|jgi:serine/threonine-protein kinase RsbW|nr:MAG: ATP-binding protein [Alphaproteobacteria bacterium]TMJ90275.1 MAG: ATP-binding protein [Alphaproteobacteria bacterium]TMJ95125.1 MAG: ATP-binding protein [Alphaproteobacteria bacterium]TMK04061.1 MAG: ATP-binding protein [Alphaproteobacteria bacterium]